MEKQKTARTEGEALAMRVSTNTVILNCILAGGKLAAGIVAHSGAMISDAVHSASDVLSTFVVMLGIHMAAKPADEGHQYGHDRIECVVGAVLGVMLGLVGVGIGVSAIQTISSNKPIAMPGVLALVAAVVSVVVKEGMYWYTIAAAKKLSSPALKADAWHHRSDALSSIGSFAGILGARLGFVRLDAIASLIICLFILKVAVDIFRDAMNRMVDKACDEATEDSMRRIMLGVPGVISVDILQTRVFGAKIYVDVEISAEGDLPLTEAHGIAERVHHAIEKDFPTVKHCMVHVNPADVPTAKADAACVSLSGEPAPADAARPETPKDE
ncbi:MAG: cation diffusion facilitator family transporter [Faecalibacterium sp.]|jgi:cation diffusion facilitator family transporter|nr:cation diffusion facilitator family transporter [Faecalibacterium sp.]